MTDVYIDAECYRNGQPDAYAVGRLKIGEEEIVRIPLPSSIKTNNQAEFAILLHALHILKFRNQGARIISDSQIVVNMVNKKWEGSNLELRRLRDVAVGLIASDETIYLEWKPRQEINAVLGEN